MQPGQIMSKVRTFGYVALLAAGLTLGAAAPVLADMAGSEIAMDCGAATAAPVGASEWAVPSSPGQPGKPY